MNALDYMSRLSESYFKNIVRVLSGKKKKLFWRVKLHFKCFYDLT